MQGIPFRTSHDIVGRSVALAVSKRCQLLELSLEELRSISSIFDEDVYNYLGAGNAIHKFKSYGSTGVACVKEQMEFWLEKLGLKTNWVPQNLTNISYMFVISCQKLCIMTPIYIVVIGLKRLGSNFVAIYASLQDGNSSIWWKSWVLFLTESIFTIYLWMDFLLLMVYHKDTWL